jgi:hypothetical protein
MGKIVGKLELICQKEHSKIYKETLDDKIYCLKIYRSWVNCDLPTMLLSYLRYFKLENKEGLVKIYDIWNEDIDVYIRMEYLEDYISLKDWTYLEHTAEQHEFVMIKVFKILANLILQGYINVDCGNGTFMINKNLDIKMIDLDLLDDCSFHSLHHIGDGIVDILRNCRCHKIKESGYESGEENGS